MELLLILIYTAICVAVFKIFRIPVNKWTLPTAALGGIFMIGLILLVMNYNHPFSSNARIYFTTTPILPDVRGRVVEVPVQPNTLLKQGDVLFRIDPQPYQYVVDQKKALLAEAEQSVRQLAWELGAKDIRVNAISAGPVSTLAARGISGFTGMLRHHAEKAPLRRNITREEVGSAALFLLSEMSSGVTGGTLFVDAGYHVMGL